MLKRDFNKLLFEAIDEGLSSMGESSKQAIYFHLKKGFNVDKHEIPRKIEDFARGIERIFGSGANVLEILIMKNLYEKAGRTVQLLAPKDFEFIEYVAATKRSFTVEKKAEGLVQCDQMVSEG
jgi:hypothetical protein